jgi:hypothetical protein
MRHRCKGGKEAREEAREERWSKRLRFGVAGDAERKCVQRPKMLNCERDERISVETENILTMKGKTVFKSHSLQACGACMR